MFNVTSKEQVIVNTWYGGDEEGYVLYDELLLAIEGYGCYALLCKH